jgi:hypothetical protein
MPSWLVHLQGAPSDLGALADLLGPGEPGDPEVVIEGDDYYLKCNSSESRTNAREGFEYATSLLPLLAKAMEVATGRAPELTTTKRIVEVSDDGTRQTFYHVSQTFTILIDAPATIRAVGTVVGADGSVKAPAPTTGAIRPWIREAQRNPDVQRVLSWLEPDLRELYKALDAVKVELGGWPEIWTKGWATEAQINRFKHTAQGARHGRRFEPPKKPMSTQEALDLVRHVVARWLDWKSQKSPP